MSANEEIRQLSVVFDCRRFEGNEEAYAMFRRVTREQCTRLLSLAIFQGVPRNQLLVKLFLLSAAEVRVFEEHLTEEGVLAEPNGSWLSLMEELEKPLCLSYAPLTAAAFSLFADKVEPARQCLEMILSAAPQKHLALLCTVFATLDEVIRSLSSLSVHHLSQEICCVVPDWQAVRASKVQVSHARLRMYRCPYNPAQLQSALQDALSSFVLPGLNTTRRVLLRAGDTTVMCKAMVPHYAEGVRRCCRVDDVASSTAVASGGFFGGNRLQYCPTERMRYEVMTERGEATPCVLQVRSVMTPDCVDETFLMGDTWLLAWDDTEAWNPSPATQAMAGAAYSSFYTFWNTFQTLVVVFEGDNRGLVSPCHVAMQRHFYAAYCCVERTLRLREIVPVELRFEPLTRPLSSRFEGLNPPEDAALKKELNDVRSRLLAQDHVARFAWADALSASLTELVKHVVTDNTRMLVLQPPPPQRDP
jgi:hypothetical protein